MKEVITTEKCTKYLYNNKLHRIDGPAIEYSNGSKSWFFNGKLHRINGPAVEWHDGSKQWYIKGKLHRKDGPAIIWPSGSKSWWINGYDITTLKIIFNEFYMKLTDRIKLSSN